MKKKVKANELTDVDVSHISLVGHGANREPFRLMKEDSDVGKGTLDLSKLFFNKQAKPVAPMISAIIIPKDDDTEEIRKRLADAGFDTQAKVEDENSAIIFAQKGDKKPLEDVALIKADENIVLAVKGLSKNFIDYDFSNESFADAISQQGFYPQIYVAMDVLQNVLISCMSSSTSSADSAAKVGAAIDDFRGYVLGLINELPLAAFTLMKAERPMLELKVEESEITASVLPIKSDTPVGPDPVAEPTPIEAEQSTPEGDPVEETPTVEPGDVEVVEEPEGEPVEAAPDGDPASDDDQVDDDPEEDDSQIVDPENDQPEQEAETVEPEDEQSANGMTQMELFMAEQREMSQRFMEAALGKMEALVDSIKATTAKEDEEPAEPVEPARKARIKSAAAPDDPEPKSVEKANDSGWLNIDTAYGRPN